MSDSRQAMEKKIKSLSMIILILFLCVAVLMVIAMQQDEIMVGCKQELVHCSKIADTLLMSCGNLCPDICGVPSPFDMPMVNMPANMVN